jgi:phage-related protein
MPAVFNIRLTWPVVHELVYSTHVFDFGDGYEQRINLNSSWGPRANGEGGLIAYRGRNIFRLTMNAQEYQSNNAFKEANKHWNFFKARLGGYDPFYFYNPVERGQPDITGTDQTGRYLVRYRQQNLTREQFMLQYFRSQIELIEVRE